ncbi:ABC transporter permease [Azorhizobium caulinodans]|uniref:ABC transporter permease protein n=1 Tax=Azorhizobium caulinodans (strain ATCC 43989 / DSM 5975 / JCM 20966 / LMG 6465 / NBRC 14845 / NCIMB 13405 / ORS 571) TaxID=438753 RepID=A8I6U9_AZOC5|nr:ABC transporter permease [Azorhizobium caulinodans]BAF88044.1 ABC transporter permease protein [Azorhizobium caulinodans ORS 571]
MQTLQFLLWRLAKGILVVLAIVILDFFLIHMAPGDPASVMAGESGATDEAFVQQLRVKFGLDQPLTTQLGLYLWGVVRLDLGFSHRQQMPVLDLVLDRLPATLLLTGAAFVFSLTLGVVLGAWAAAHKGRPLDRIITTVSLVFYAAPLFWMALMAVLIFSVWLDWLPAFGIRDVGGDAGLLDRTLDVARHLVLPAVTLGLFFTAVYVRMTRASMIEVARQDFVKTCRAKGLPERVILRRHVLRNAVLPVVTLAGLQAGQMVGGAVMTETVFAWPGIGRLMYEALIQRDYNLLLGVFVVSAAMVVVFNILTDLVYRMVDPRIEVSR